MTRANQSPWWYRALLAVAVAKIVGGLIGVGLDPGVLWRSSPLPLPAWPYLLQMLCYSASAWVLWTGGRRDRRSRSLALAWVLIAAAFANRLLVDGWAGTPEPLPFLARRLAIVAVDAFLPYALWQFATDFPNVPLLGRSRTLPRFMTAFCFGLGAVLLTGNLALAVVPEVQRTGPLVRILELLTLKRALSIYWFVVFMLILGALAFIVWKSRRAPIDERRRGRLFLSGLVLGAAPICIEALLEGLIPPFAELMQRPVAVAVVGAIVLPALLSVPVTTTYAVLVHRALDVRLVLRRALHYALARYTILSAVAAPFVLLAVLLVVQRDRPFAEVLSGTNALFLIFVGGAALVASRVRRPALDWLDRSFFREEYDAHRILSRLVEQTATAETPEDLSDLLCREIDRALHVDRVLAVVFDPTTRQFLTPDGRFRGLEAASPLARLAAERGGPLEVDLERSADDVAGLPRAEREWLADGDVRLIVPLVGSSRQLLGLIALGDKRSELPYSVTDLDLLSNVAASGALAFENRLLTSSGAMGPGSDDPATAVAGAADHTARECRQCGILYDSKTQSCRQCGDELVHAPVPRVLHGKFRIEERIGRGGMGVVFRGTDLELRRPVAIKTLPSLDPSRAVRLRREARAMAAIHHSNLALIYGIESWYGVPLLVLELLEGGTLATRLKSGPLTVGEAIEMTIALSNALDRVHRVGMLHRDIKPSNIGFDADGTVKLLDFGLVRLFAGSPEGAPAEDGVVKAASSAVGVAGRESELRPGTPNDLTATTVTRTVHGYVAGTPLYLSPEAVRHCRPEPSFDLWSLAVVLYETIAGRHPLLDPAGGFTIGSFPGAGIPDVRSLRPDVPEDLAEFLGSALSFRLADRPATAKLFGRRLEMLSVSRETRTLAG